MRVLRHRHSSLRYFLTKNDPKTRRTHRSGQRVDFEEGGEGVGGGAPDRFFCVLVSDARKDHGGGMGWRGGVAQSERAPLVGWLQCDVYFATHVLTVERRSGALLNGFHVSTKAGRPFLSERVSQFLRYS